MLRRQRAFRSTIALAASLTSVAISGLASAEQSTPDSGAEKVTFEEHVKPIFRQHCLTCHNLGEKKGGLALDSYQAVLEGGGSGEVVYDDGDYAGSRLWQLVSHEDTPIMPPGQDKIPAEQLAVLQAWIEGGILENSGSKAKAKKKNPLEFVAASRGKPEGPAAMPETVSMGVPVVTNRPAAVTAIACSPWAPLVAVGGQRQVVLYHGDNGELLGVLPFAEGIPQSIRFSSDGGYLFVAGGEHAVLGLVAIYDVRTGERIATVGDELDIVFDGDANSDMTRVAMGGPKRMLRIYDVTDGSLKFDLKKHTDWILAVAFSPDDVLIASGDRSAGLVVWEADTGQPYLDLAGHKGAVTAVSWRDDGNVLASGSEDGTVKLWDMHTGNQIKSINVGGPVQDVAFDHQGRLITASGNRKATVWDAGGSKVRDLPAMQEAVLEAALSHDGKRAVYGDWSGQIFNVATDDPKQTLTLASNPPDERELLAAASQKLKAAQAELKKATDDLQPIQTKVQTMKDAVDVAKRDLASKRDRLEELKSTLAELNQKEQSAQGTIRKAAEAADVSHDEMIAAKVALKRGDIDDQRLAAAEQQVADAFAALAESRRGLLATREQIVSVAAQRKQIQEAIPTLEKAVSDAYGRLQAAQAELEPAEQTRRGADAVVQQLSDRVRRIEAAIEASI
ncbi:c-type cytochrome domain-containing protein [Crateriforma conspicua]|uniref:c-type cytochrome domain-containing protein n=1 Tax=Crateriforma conspicua TaxID=2527996 RepID=UPI00118C0D95|nr:c-type cytochrome domain-containing protein [Crateriforma conspicua]QDV64671.1 Chromosome partition protein Smc [Crateriforma conspicua]